MEHQITINRDDALKLFNFIRTNLSVVNDEPEVEDFMLTLEDLFDIDPEEYM